MALPIWLADELWVEEQDILEDDEVKEAATFASQKGRKRKGREDDADAVEGTQSQKSTSAHSTEKKQKTLQVREKQTPTKVKDADLGVEMALRRERLRQAKKEARAALVGGPVGSEAGNKELVEGEKKVKIAKTKKVKKVAAVEPVV